MKRTRVLVFLSLLMAMDVILTRYLSIQFPTLRISLGFIPTALSAILFGPVASGITAGLADIIGFFLKPSGDFFPGFTLSAIAGGVIYGIFLYKKPVTVLRISLAVVIITLFVNLGMNTVWVSMLTGKAAMAIIAPRITKSLIILPIQVILIKTVWKLAGEQIQKRIMQ